jgi:hypothetical protein
MYPATLIASFYGLMSWRLLPYTIAAFLYCVGVNSFVTIYTATFNYKYLDLRKSGQHEFPGNWGDAVAAITGDFFWPGLYSFSC